MGSRNHICKGFDVEGRDLPSPHHLNTPTKSELQRYESIPLVIVSNSRLVHTGCAHNCVRVRDLIRKWAV